MLVGPGFWKKLRPRVTAMVCLPSVVERWTLYADRTGAAIRFRPAPGGANAGFAGQHAFDRRDQVVQPEGLREQRRAGPRSFTSPCSWAEI